MTTKVSCIDTFVVIVFNRPAKLIPIPNKIVGTKMLRKLGQKTSNRGGGQTAVPTHKVWSRTVYNGVFSMCRSELKADKSTALKWLAYDKAFKPIDNDKTYAQALTQTKSNKCYDVQPLRAAIAKPNKQFLPTAKVHRKYQSKLYHNKASLANNG